MTDWNHKLIDQNSKRVLFRCTRQWHQFLQVLRERKTKWQAFACFSLVEAIEVWFLDFPVTDVFLLIAGAKSCWSYIRYCASLSATKRDQDSLKYLMSLCKCCEMWLVCWGSERAAGWMCFLAYGSNRSRVRRWCAVGLWLPPIVTLTADKRRRHFATKPTRCTRMSRNDEKYQKTTK